MRVIAGSAGGIRLAVPKRGVRPTMDRVKAAIFSSLGDSMGAAVHSELKRSAAARLLLFLLREIDNRQRSSRTIWPRQS